MKKIFGFLLILTLVVLATYYGMGAITEITLKKNIDVLNHSNGIVVKLQRYHRGWFHSQAELQWTLKIPQKTNDKLGHTFLVPNKIYTVQIPLEIYHGPIMIINARPRFGLGYARSDVALPPIYEQQFSAVFDSSSVKPLLNIDIFVDYLTKTTVQLSVPSFKLVAKEGGDQFQWLGMNTDLVVSAHRDQLRGHLMIKGFTWFSHGIKGILGAVSSDYDLHRELDELYLGSAHLLLPSVELFENNQQIGKIIGLTVASKSDVRNDLFFSSLSIHVDHAVLRQQKYGPTLLDLSIHDLDAKVLANMNKKFSRYQSGSEQERQQLIITLIPELPALLSKGARFSVSNFLMSFPEGQLQANIDIALPNELVVNPFHLLKKIAGTGKLKISSLLLQRWLQQMIKPKIEARMQQTSADAPVTSGDPKPLSASEVQAQVTANVNKKIQELLSAGVLSKDGNDYLLMMKFTRGKLYVNEHPFTPSMIAF